MEHQPLHTSSFISTHNAEEKFMSPECSPYWREHTAYSVAVATPAARTLCYSRECRGETVRSTAIAAWNRVIWIVLDSVGIGELPDAAEYSDVGRNTLGHIAESRPLQIPNLVRMGLANIEPMKHLQPVAAPLAA